MKTAALALMASSLVACFPPPVEAPDTTVSQVVPISVKQNVQNQVDILFMVDNSASMSAMQDELTAKFPQFLQVFDRLAHPTVAGVEPQYADLHIGVVTSDYGAGGTKYGSCDKSPGGQNGLLQAKGVAAPASCAAPSGTPFISYAFAAGGDTCNLPGGCNATNLGQTFSCMAQVGASGCGFEHQLESVYAALKDKGAANPGFLRPSALLAVVFVTNEDDGSAPPTTTLYDAGNGPFGPYDTFRQTRGGIACGNPLAMTPYAPSLGPLLGCQPAPNNGVQKIGEEYDVSRYADFLTKPGQVKSDPTNDVILVGIMAPASPVETLLARKDTGAGKAPNPTYQACSPLAPPECFVALQHSCQNQVAPAFFGDPPLRIASVIAKAHLSQTANICGDDPAKSPDYSAALQKVADQIASTLQPGCIPAPLLDLMHPTCDVQDVTTLADGTETQKSILPCSEVTAGTVCWRVVDEPKCKGISPQGVAVSVDRHGQPVPNNTHARVECSTKACPAENPNC